MIGITLDIDWAPDFFIDEVAELLATAGVAATWYVTHRSPAVDRLRDHARFELGIHPNFLPGSSHGTTPTEVLRSCMEMVPDAVSMRTHALVQSTPLLARVLQETPVRTDVSLFLDGAEGLRRSPFWWGGGGACLWRLPFCWEDDFAMETPGWSGSSYDGAILRRPGLRIVNVHPLHIGLNTGTLNDYRPVKAAYPDIRTADEAGLRSFRRGEGGVRTWLESLLADIQSSGLPTFTVRELSAVNHETV